jgi:hypothetical protein
LVGKRICLKIEQNPKLSSREQTFLSKLIQTPQFVYFNS